MPLRALLGNYLYRRVALWIILLSLVFFGLLLKKDVRSRTAKVVGFDGLLGHAQQPSPQSSPPISPEMPPEMLKIPEALDSSGNPVVPEAPEQAPEDGRDAEEMRKQVQKKLEAEKQKELEEKIKAENKPHWMIYKQ